MSRVRRIAAQLYLLSGLIVWFSCSSREAADTASAVSCGPTHECAVLTDGRVACWGDNEFRQLGVETMGSRPGVVVRANGIENAVEVTAGARHSCALLRNGDVSCWGHNTFGELGSGDLLEAFEPVTVAGVPPMTAISAGYQATCAVSDTGEVWCWGAGRGRAYKLAGAAGIVGIRVTRNIAYAWTAEGDVFQVPIRSAARGEQRRIEPVEAAPHLGEVDGLAVHSEWWSRHWTCFRSGEDVHCQSDIQAAYILGDVRDEPVEIPSLRKALRLAMGSEHLCGLFAESPHVRCLGSNELGRLGDGLTEHEVLDPNPCSRVVSEAGEWWIETWDCSLEAVGVRGVTNATDLCASSSSACAVTDEGHVYCWGGIGTEEPPGETPQRIDLSEVEVIDTTPVHSVCPTFGDELKFVTTGTSPSMIEPARGREFVCELVHDYEGDEFDCANGWDVDDTIEVTSLGQTSLVCPQEFTFGNDAGCSYTCIGTN